MAIIGLGLATLGCSKSAPPLGAVGHVQSYFGGVAADEPRAALIGRDILSAGGTAVDAVVAMSMMMMVTRPDAAGPGGGGMCVVYDSKKKAAEALEFLPHASRTPPAAGRWIAAVPGSFRGLFALHARNGQLRWEQLVQPAERLARFGVRLPRVLGKSLARYGADLAKDARARAIFFDGAGLPLQEGDALRQVNLGTTLARIRSTGPGDFYSGLLGKQYVEEVRRMGGWLTKADLRDYKPRWEKTIQGKFGPHDVHFLPSPVLGGKIAAEIWEALGDDGDFPGADEREKASMLTKSAVRAYAGALTNDRSATATAGVLSIDRTGNAAACVLTMNKPFGVGRIAGDTGIIPTGPADGNSILAMSAMIVANRHVPESHMAATGTGGPAAPVALMGVALRVLGGAGGVEASIAAPRSAPMGQTGGTIVEKGAPQLTAKGQVSAAPPVVVPSIGVVNVMYCPEGMVHRPNLCVVRADPRGFGYAVNAEY